MRAALLILSLLAVPALSAEGHTNHDMREHMDDDPLNAMFSIDRLELRDAEAGAQLGWDLNAWIGRDFNKLVLRSEGESLDGKVEGADLAALWSRPLARWWDVVAGLRHEFQPEDSRTWLALGITGLMPYQFHLQVTAYAGEQGRTALQLESGYELLLTNRLILQPRLEINAFGRSDARRGIGSGVSDLELGLRLRYEIRREVAPYLGVAWVNKFGRTADFAAASGEDAHEIQALIGLRAWY